MSAGILWADGRLLMDLIFDTKIRQVQEAVDFWSLGVPRPESLPAKLVADEPEVMTTKLVVVDKEAA
jgi:hypothetical protein